MPNIIVKAFGIQDDVLKLQDIGGIFWNTFEGIPTDGSAQFRQSNSTPTTNSIDEYVLLEFEKAGTETPTSVELTSFQRKCVEFNDVANASIEIKLVKPDASEVSIKGPVTISAVDGAFVQEGAVSLTASDFATAGRYKIFIRQKVDITLTNGTFRVVYDDIRLTIDTTSAITGMAFGIQDDVFDNTPSNSDLGWETDDGDPVDGCTNLKINLMSGSDTADYLLLRFSKTGTVADQEIPSFKRKVTQRDALTTTTIEIFLKQPDSTLISLKGPITISATDGSFVQEGPITITAAQMSQDGEYAVMVRQISTV